MGHNQPKSYLPNNSNQTHKQTTLAHYVFDSHYLPQCNFFILLVYIGLCALPFAMCFSVVCSSLSCSETLSLTLSLISTCSLFPLATVLCYCFSVFDSWILNYFLSSCNDISLYLFACVKRKLYLFAYFTCFYLQMYLSIHKKFDSWSENSYSESTYTFQFDNRSLKFKKKTDPNCNQKKRKNKEEKRHTLVLSLKI